MEVQSFSSQELFAALVNKEDFLLLDVRNDEEFGRFKVEGPFPLDMVNVPYMEFIEHEEESVAKVPRGKKVRVVCAKEGSSKYVAEILLSHGFEDVAHMIVGIKAWGNLLSPVKVGGGDDFDLYQFRRPGKASCSYGLIYGPEMMVFDPAKNIDAYTDFAQGQGCTITRTFETHCQADYISGSMALKATVGAEIVAPDEDFHVATFDYTSAADGSFFQFSTGGPEIKAIHTPGHTPGSTCYLIDNRYIVTGDTVFILSIGRPDLGGMVQEWSKMLYATMTQKIMQWDNTILVLPGHYMDWKEANPELSFAKTLEQIKAINTDIYSIADEDAFYDFIKSNMRKQPDEYAKIREINVGLVVVDDEDADIMDLGKNECAASQMAK